MKRITIAGESVDRLEPIRRLVRGYVSVPRINPLHGNPYINPQWTTWP